MHMNNFVECAIKFAWTCGLLTSISCIDQFYRPEIMEFGHNMMKIQCGRVLIVLIL